MMNRRGFLWSASALGTLFALPKRLLAATLGYPRLLQGPMVGATTPDSVTIWSRATGVFDVAVDYATNRDFSDAKTTTPVRADPANDLTTRITIPGLKPDTEYFYRIRTDGIGDRNQPLPFRVRTAPADRRPLRIAFGSCARVQLDAVQPVFEAIRQMEPDLFLWLGDNIYADSDTEAAFTDLYARQRSVASLQPLLRSVPQLAIWDDHDFGFNDSDGTSPVKPMTLKLFDRWWANPAGGTADTPGVFFRYSFGPVDIFMLDGRYHRDPPKVPNGPAKTMLGAGQKAWLKRELKASKAVFKILASSTGWSRAESGGDSWAMYLDERDEILNFIRDNRITGCFGISGDVHMGEMNCVPWGDKGSYDFYDLVSSGLAQMLNPRFVDQTPEVRLRAPWVGSANFGILDFRFDPEPVVEMSVRNVLGGAVWDPVVVKAADLVNGRSTWRTAIDRKELERRERAGRGGGYYESK
ncbi:alkaline phosphatase D family protein [Sphingomonas sp.]|uniref:alkaline phosphatase D family protein n=1 Tax=Sphingomonas sp. TaxID=28214 RepID=UPI002DD62C17|nr:alkaline phosphatase D family protein [Sphingomonas sp.]